MQNFRTSQVKTASVGKTILMLSALCMTSMPLGPGTAFSQEEGAAAGERAASRSITEKVRKPARRIKQAMAESHKPVPATAVPPAAVAPQAPVLNICVINRQYIVQQADINVASTKRLAELREQAQAEITKAQQVLQADLRALNDEKRSPNDEVLKSKAAALDVRVQALAAKADMKRRQIEMTRDIVNKQISTAALPLLQAAEKEKSCTLLLSQESVLDGSVTTDITPIVMAAMNAQLHPMPFALAEPAPSPTK